MSLRPNFYTIYLTKFYHTIQNSSIPFIISNSETFIFQLTGG